MALADAVQTHGSDACPQCGAPLVLRLTGGQGHPRRRFWGCSTFPVTGCRGVRPFEGTLSETASAWTGPPTRRDHGHERTLTRVALAAVIAHEVLHEVAPPRPVSDAPSARAARRQAAAARVGREYHRRVDSRMARIGDRWPLMLMAYTGFAGGSVMATAWIHPVVAGVTLMAMTAWWVEALLRPSAEPAPAQGHPDDDGDARLAAHS
jgi:hypothetical protein